MSLKNAGTALIVLALLLFYSGAVAGAQSPSPQPSQPYYSDIKGAVVTLYYYDPVTKGKGAIVPLPEGQNPQEVQWDANISAPGTYTFYKVPFGTYYIEAVHNGHAWFAIANVGAGTTTANVAIPPNGTTDWRPVAEAPSATATPSPAATATPLPTSSPTPSPGLTTSSALIGLMIVMLYVVHRKK